MQHRCRSVEPLEKQERLQAASGDTPRQTPERTQQRGRLRRAALLPRWGQPTGLLLPQTEREGRDRKWKRLGGIAAAEQFEKLGQQRSLRCQDQYLLLVKTQSPTLPTLRRELRPRCFPNDREQQGQCRGTRLDGPWRPTDLWWRHIATSLILVKGTGER